MTTLVPGEYLFDVPDTDGLLMALCRCPGCFQDFQVTQSGKPELSTGHPLMLECSRCGRYDTYRSANYRQGAPEVQHKRPTKIRRPNGKSDPSLFG